MNQPSSTPNVGLRWKIARLAESIGAKQAKGDVVLDDVERDQARRLRDILVDRKPLAEFSGITVATIANIEGGRSNNPPTVARYFEALLSYIDSLSAQDRLMPDWLDFPVGTWVNGTGTLCGLLDPELRSVEFHGDARKKALQRLKDWCTTDHKVALRSLKAEGGVGKTRLGVELCQQLTAGTDVGTNEPWTVGFVRPHLFPAEVSPWSTARFAGRNLLMIFDYAGGPESLPVIKRLLPHLVEPTACRTRILLLDRRDYWLAELLLQEGFQAVKRRHSISREFSEPELGDAYDKGGRAHAFATAVAGFQKKLETEGSVQAPANLDSPTFDRVLLLHMRALLAITGSTQAAEMKEVLDECMDRERRQWVRRMEIRKVDGSFRPLVEQVYWLIAAEGGVATHEVALKVACTDAAFNSLGRFIQDQILGVLHDCYASSARYIEPLRPDLLGEHFLSQPPTQARRGHGKQRR